MNRSRLILFIALCHTPLFATSHTQCSDVYLQPATRQGAVGRTQIAL